MRKTNKRNNKAGTYTFDIKKKRQVYIFIYGPTTTVPDFMSQVLQ